MLRCLLLASTAWFSMIATVPAQELPRARALGQVRTLAGKPWVGATVHLWSVTSRSDPTYEVDRVVTKTDTAGRFRASILTGRTYHAWATMSGKESRYRASKIQDVQPEMPVTLRQARGDYQRRIIRIKQPESLTRVGSLRVVARILRPARINFELERTEAGWRMPELPAEWLSGLTVYGSRGASVDVFVVNVFFNWTGAQPIDIALSVRKVAIVARSLPRGEPMVGAEVFWQSATRYYSVGRTDATGRVEVHMLQFEGEFPHERLFVHKPGWAPSRLKHDDKQDVYVAEMARAAPDIATVRLDPRQPASDLLVETPIPRGFHDDRYGPTVASFRTDAKGRFRFHTDEPRDGMLVAALRREHIAALPAAWRRGLSPHAVLGRSRKAGLGLEFVLGYTPPVDLRIKAPDGAPASGAKVVFHTSKASPLVLRADRLGRLRVILPNRVPVCVGVQHATGFRFRTLYRVTRDQEPQVCEIRLVPPITLRGRVVGALGRGVAGASAILFSIEAPVEPPQRARFATNPGVQLIHLVSNPALARLARVFGPRVETGADGKFAMQLPSVELRYKLIASDFENGRSHSHLTDVPVSVVREGDQFSPIELPLDWPKNSKK